MKKFMKLIPAFVMLLVSAILVSTATYAWFSMNTTVTATGMKVQAKSEAGLLISADKTDASWADTDATVYDTVVSLVPTSTNDLATWYHNVSNSADNYAHSGTYNTLSATSGENQIVVITEDVASNDAVANITYANDDGVTGFNNSSDTGYYLMTRFFIKSSGDALTINPTGSAPNNWLEIKTISITGMSSSVLLDASLRIGIKLSDGTNTSFKILAPFAAAAGLTADATAGTITYNVNGSTSTTANKGLIATGTTAYKAHLDSGFAGTIPAKTTDSPMTMDVYLWFEGEDVNCKTNNIVATLDTLVVSVELGLVAVTPTNVASAS